MKKIALLALIVTACGVAGTPEDFDGAWELASGTHQGAAIPILQSHPITMSIGGDAIGGTAACNSYGGNVMIGAGGSFSIGDGVAITEMACMPIEVMEAEQAFVAALVDADRITRTGDTIRLTGPDTDLTFTLIPPVPTADLVGTVWVLDGLISADAVTSVSGDRATLILSADGTFEGETGCRTFSGEYVVAAGEVQFTNFGANGECDAELRDQDSRVISALEGGFRVEIVGDRMTTRASGDEGLSYRAES